MLVVTRRAGESITTTGPAEFVVLRQKGNCSVIGIIADKGVKILRTELEPKELTSPEDPDK